MKKLGIITLLAVFLVQGFGQEVSAEKQERMKQVEPSDTSDNLKIIIGKDRLILENTGESTSIRTGNRGVLILESLEGASPDVEFVKYENEEAKRDDDDDKDKIRTPGRTRFKGHWAGLEIGLNNYLTTDHELSLPTEINYMTLHSAKSRTFGLNFGQLSIGLGRHIGFVTGLGIVWNNYRFDGNNNIQKSTAGVIEVLDPGDDVLKKSKLSTFYLKIPLLLEFQIPTDHNRLNISAGPVGAVKLSSNSVMVFDNNDKVKSDGDFNLNILRYGATARIGYENFNIFATYYFTPLFKSGKGPGVTEGIGSVDLFPFEIGFAFTIDN